MVRQRQRRRQLARQKYERQNVRRSAKARRSRTISIVVFTILGLIGIVAAILFVTQILDQDDDNNPTPDQTTVTPLDPEQQPGDTGTTESAPTESAPTNDTPSETQGN